MKINIYFICLFILFLSSCKVYFTQERRDQLVAKNIPMTKVQFFNSKTILLHREIPKLDLGIIDTLKTRKDDSIQVEEILIKRNTPGICVIDTTNNQLEICFETGDNRIIKFGTDPEIKGGFYYIQALTWEKGVGKIPYDNKTFSILAGQTSRLKIKTKLALKFMSVKVRVVKGRTLN